MTKTAISSLFLAVAASTASAAPSKDETAERVSYTEKTAKKDVPDGWVQLASPTPAKHGRTFITVDGRYAQLRIDAKRPVVKTVRIVYSDGKERVVKVKHQRSSVIDLAAGQSIDHIVVNSDHRAKGTYTVSAMPAEATGVASR